MLGILEGTIGGKEDLDARVANIRRLVNLYDTVYGIPIREGVVGIALSAHQKGIIEEVKNHIKYALWDVYPKWCEDHNVVQDLLEPLEAIERGVVFSANRMGFSHDIDTYIAKRDGHRYSVWHPEEALISDVERGNRYRDDRNREIGTIYGPPSGTAFGMRLIYDKARMWTDQADVALIVDSREHPLEGFQCHNWVWFKDGETVDPKKTELNDQPAYDNLFHALDDIAKRVGLFPCYFKRVITDSTLTPEHRASLGLTSPSYK
jgi:hypothetical protein